MFDIETCVAFITNKSAKKVAEAFNDRLSVLGITRVQWIALYFLGMADGITQNELAEKMDIKASTVARLIDRMERDGYFIRVRDIKDKRNVNLHLTEKGRIYRENLLPEGEKMGALVSRDISDEEIEIFQNVLKKMLNNLK